MLQDQQQQQCYPDRGGDCIPFSTVFDSSSSSASSSLLRYCTFKGYVASNKMSEMMYIPIIIVILYWMIVFYFNTNTKDDNKTKDRIIYILKNKCHINGHTRPIWNLGLCLFSLLGTIHVTSNLVYRVWNNGFYSSICESSTSAVTVPRYTYNDGNSNNSKNTSTYLNNYYDPSSSFYNYYGNSVTGFWIFLFVISKIFELGDTLFLIVSQYQTKRNSNSKPPISFLHYYHHSSVLLWSWYEYTQQTSMCHWFASMNYTVHTIMYAYFAFNDICKDTDHDNNKRLFRIKSAYRITIIQILQMIIGCSIVIFVTVNRFLFESFTTTTTTITCHTSTLSLIASGWIYFSYLILFLQFAEEKYAFFCRFRHYITETIMAYKTYTTSSNDARHQKVKSNVRTSISCRYQEKKVVLPWQKQNLNISEQFNIATKLATMYSHVATTEDMMCLYGNYKQVKDGSIPIDYKLEDNNNNIQEKMKYNAWYNMRHCSKEQAQVNYIQKMDQLACKDYEERQNNHQAEQLKHSNHNGNSNPSKRIHNNKGQGDEYAINSSSGCIDNCTNINCSKDPFILYPVRIAGVGAYLPKRVVYNSEIDDALNQHQRQQKGTSNCNTNNDNTTSGSNTIRRTSTNRSGVITRHYVDIDNGENSIQNACKAIIMACQKANISLSDIDLIIGASGTPHQAIPDDACLVQNELGLGNSGIPAFSVHATCISFLLGINVAGSYMKSSQQLCNNVVIFSSCVSSACLNKADSHTSGLFGDGAAAIVLQRNNNINTNTSAIHRFHMETYGTGSNLCRIEGGGTNRPSHHPLHNEISDYFQMDGANTLRLISKYLGPALNKFIPGLQYGLNNLQIEKLIISSSLVTSSNDDDYEETDSIITSTANTGTSSIIESFSTPPSPLSTTSDNDKIPTQLPSSSSSSSSSFSSMSGEEEQKQGSQTQSTAEISEGLKTKVKAKLTKVPIDIDWVIPHQASGLALDSLLMFGWEENKILKTLHKYGNCVGASIPLTLYDGIENGKIQRGDKVLLCGTSAGISFGAVLLTY